MTYTDIIQLRKRYSSTYREVFTQKVVSNAFTACVLGFAMVLAMHSVFLAWSVRSVKYKHAHKSSATVLVGSCDAPRAVALSSSGGTLRPMRKHTHKHLTKDKDDSFSLKRTGGNVILPSLIEAPGHKEEKKDAPMSAAERSHDTALTRLPENSEKADALVETNSSATAEAKENFWTWWKEHQTKVDIAVSVMLLGSVAFLMSLFYAIHNPYEDMQRYSWEVISSTISIFCGVLCFQAWNGVVEKFVVRESKNDALRIGVDVVQVVAWFTALQLVLAYASGSLGKRPSTLDDVEVNMQSWAHLFAHTAGFAAINFLSEVQQQEWFKQNAVTLFVVVPVGWIALYGFCLVWDWMRWRVAHADDGWRDEYEEAWDRHAVETENDVIGISVSFVAVQVFRFAISGVLPDAHGIEAKAKAYDHNATQVALLCGVGIGLACVTVLTVFVSKAVNASHTHPYIERMLDIMENITAFASAWCFFHATAWGFHSTKWGGHEHDEALIDVVLALFLSFVTFLAAFVVLWFLDKLAEREARGHAGEKAIRTIVEALGLLVGLSWTEAFEHATTNVVDGLLDSLNPAVAKLILSFLLVAIVFPAWRFYILPTVLQLEKKHRAEIVEHPADLASAGGQRPSLHL